MLRKFASNALANLTTGLSGTVFQVGLTAIATRSFDKEGFSVWALAWSMAAWVPLFSVNLSTVVTRRLVEAPSAAGAITLASKELAVQLSVAAFAVILLLSAGLLLTSKPLAEAKPLSFLTVVALLTLAQLWQVVLQPTFGRSYACEENWRVARTVILSRIGALLSIGAFCWTVGTSLEIAALGLLMGTVAGLLVGLGSCRDSARPVALAAEVSAERRLIRPLLGAFAIWSIGSAMIQNGLPAFLSLIAPDRFNAFFLAYTLNMVVVGTIGAASSALLAPLARMRVVGRSEQLKRWLATAPAATGGILLVLMLIVWYTLPWLLPVWSPGVANVQDVRHYLFWLSIQTMVRSTCLVYSVVLSSAGKPTQLRQPIFIELTIAIALALPLGWWFGDVALLCTLAGAGWIASVFTSWTTLTLDEHSSQGRRQLLALFVATQLTVTLLWAEIAR